MFSISDFLIILKASCNKSTADRKCLSDIRASNCSGTNCNFSLTQRQAKVVSNFENLLTFVQGFEAYLHTLAMTHPIL